MRKIKFYINDTEYFRKLWKKENPTLSKEEIETLVGNIETFEAVCTLEGTDKTIQSYKLSDKYGNKIVLSYLNAHQKGVIGIILADCKKYFEGHCDSPIGVIDIQTEETTELAGFIFQHDSKDHSYWYVDVSKEDKNKIMEILVKYHLEGYSER